MDEEKKGFSIPPKKSLFDEPAVDSVEVESMEMGDDGFIASFENMDGTKAVNIAAIEVGEDGEFIGKLDNAEMETYAQSLMEGGDDVRNLQVGDIYEGENALADAQAEADRLTTEYAPMPDASDEEKAMAINDAKASAKMGESEESFEDIEEEPMLKQMEGKEKPFGEEPMGEEELSLPLGEE